MVHFALQRVRARLALPRMIVVNETAENLRAVEDTGLILLCLTESEMENQIFFVPL
jgi:hypothetical protein